MADQELMTVPEVAVRLRLSRETVRRLLRDGHLAGVRTGTTRGGWRVTKDEVARFIRAGGLVGRPFDDPR